MALEMKFIKKNEGGPMTRFKLSERTYIHVDPATHEERLANLKSDKNNVFLLGVEGHEIDLNYAIALGLLKPKKADKAE